MNSGTVTWRDQRAAPRRRRGHGSAQSGSRRPRPLPGGSRSSILGPCSSPAATCFAGTWSSYPSSRGRPPGSVSTAPCPASSRWTPSSRWRLRCSCRRPGAEAGAGRGALLGGVGAAAWSRAWWCCLGRRDQLFLWNPWVYERLADRAVGRSSSATLCLPWTALAAERARDEAAVLAVVGALVGWLGLCAVFSPASGLIAPATAWAVVVSVGCAGAQPARAPRTGAQPALDPAVAPVRRIARCGSATQFRAFAARGESALGVVASVLSLGGIWKASVVPAERESAVIVALSCLLTLSACWACGSRRRWSAAASWGCGLVGAATLVLALVTSIPTVGSVLDDLSPRLPALGLLRDSQRFLGPVVLALVPGIAGAVAWLQVQGEGTAVEALHGVAVLLVVARCCACRPWRGGSAATSVRSLPAGVVPRPRAAAGGPHGGAPLARGLPRVRLERPPGRARPGPAVLRRRRAHRRPALPRRPHHRVRGPAAQRRRPRPGLRRPGGRRCARSASAPSCWRRGTATSARALRRDGAA